MTRQTLFRHMLALRMLAAGQPELYYWLLPTKSKLDWREWRSWQTSLSIRLLSRLALETLARSLEDCSRVQLRPTKIGDTVMVRKPYRFSGGAA